MSGLPVLASGNPAIDLDRYARAQSPSNQGWLDLLLGTRIIRLTDHEMRMAVIMLHLSDRLDIVLHWVKLVQRQKWRWKPGLAQLVTKEVLQMWCQRFADDSIVRRCLADSQSCLRGSVHSFLVQSVLAERVQDFVRAGMLVPPSFVLGKYLSMLETLPHCQVVDSHRSSLQNHPHAAKKWSRRFRENWGLSWGSPSMPHGISQGAAARRAGVFIRWIRHVLDQRLAAHHAVVVNMDETSLGNVKPLKRGFTASVGEGHFADTLAKDAAIPRTSLMASVCSEDGVQELLPQIRLVRSRDGRLPSIRVSTCYAEAGAPQLAIHGTSGFCTVRSLRFYLRLLVRTVRAARPNSVLVLVMDACPVHLVEEVLAQARRAGVYIIFVPAKMTWMLQPLDLRVFAVLKSRIREATFTAKATNRSSRLPPLGLVRVHSAAIRQVLVEQEWSDCMIRSGLTGEVDRLRPALQALLATQSLEPQAPSVAELADLLNVALPRAAKLRRLLLPASDVPGPPVGVIPDVAGVANGDGLMPNAAGIRHAAPGPIMLSRFMRLPGRPGGRPSGANMWLPGSQLQRPQTRSMAARNLAAAGASSSAPVRPMLPPTLRRLPSTAPRE